MISGDGAVAFPHHELPIMADNVTLVGGAVLTHKLTTETESFSLRATLAGTLAVDGTSTIDVTGRGAPGGGALSTGSHAGLGGGVTVDDSHGDFADPRDVGSGGAGLGGGAGGGVVRITVQSAQIDGVIRADGANGVDFGLSQVGGSGSGGSIALEVSDLSGGGAISADGGDGSSRGGTGGGGGGRVAIAFETSTLDVDDITAHAGGDSGADPAGGVGTVFIKQAGSTGDLRLVSHATTTTNGTPLGKAGDTSLVVDELLISGDGVVAFPHHELPIMADNVRLADGAVLTHKRATETESFSLETAISGTLSIDATSRIDVTGRGSLSPSNTGSRGGSYGGLGGNETEQAAYGDFRDPRDLGSGGEDNGGGSGGGLIRITVAAAEIDGAVRADGANGVNVGGSQTGSGGSGGGIRLDVQTLSGSGLLTADGGDGSSRGATGGGGRIAVYYDTLSLPVDNITAHGGNDNDPDPAGGVGTVYLKSSTGGEQLRLVSHGTPTANATPLGQLGDQRLEVDQLLISGAGVVAHPQHQMPMHGIDLTLAAGAMLTHRPTSLDEEFWLDVHLAGDLVIDADSKIDVTALGYLHGHTLPNTTVGGALDNSGGSYGGLGGGDGNALYGDHRNPDELGSAANGSTFRSAAGSGGGLVQITAQSAAVDGEILAVGRQGFDTGQAQRGGGGSGGGIRLNVGSLSGSGRIAADGGNGSTRSGTGGGGGGRVAVYSWENNVTLSQADVTANGGVGSSFDGQPGTVLITGTPAHFLTDPPGDVLAGVETLSWAGLGLDPSQHTADVVAFGSLHTIGVGLPTVGNLQWDTTRVPDGLHELQVLFRNQQGEVVGRAIRDVVINNQVAVHDGLLRADETWSASQLHVVRSDVFLRAGVTLTIEPGAIVKMVPLTKIGVEDGATFRALGTDQLPIMMTSLADDSFAGDTNLDAAQSRPLPGEWDDFVVVGSGTVEVNEFFEKRYVREEHSGSISQDTTWSPFNLHYVVGDLDVLAGTSLTLPAGSVVKFDPTTRLRTRAGAVLDVQGQLANPVYFTSIRDDHIGGDTNRNGESSSPQAGDWDNLLVEGQGTIRHAFVLYGAGATQGAIETAGAGEVLVDSTTVGNSLNDAFVTRGDGMSTLQNSVLYANARGINYGDQSTTVTNSTIDANVVGLFPHGGGRELNIYNSQITNSIQFGYRNPSILRSNNPNLFYSNIWSDPASGAENYSGLGVIDQTGTNGNISEPPGYVDAARRDYRLDFGSPAIDAADGTIALPTDFRGFARYDDPRTADSGIPDGSGVHPDMGALEFVEGADSNLDLIVSDVRGPLTATAGEIVRVDWTIRNNGTEPARGPWHDEVSLELRPDEPPILAGEFLVGEGVTLGPGESFTASELVRVPGSIIAAHRWHVEANVRGDIFEGPHRDNNTGVSQAQVMIDLPEIAVNGLPLERIFGESDEAHWFKLLAEPGQDVLVSVDRASDQGTTEIYVAQGFVPTSNRFESGTREFASSDATALLSDTTSQVYYVTVLPRTLPIAGDAIEIGAESLAFRLDSVTPTLVSNTGTSTLTIDGGGLTDSLAFELVDPSGGVHAAQQMFLHDRSRAFVTFDLIGAPVGSYALQVGAAELPNAIEVFAGEGPRLEYSLSAPTPLRAGRPTLITLNYGNNGTADAQAPLLTFGVLGGSLQCTDFGPVPAHTGGPGGGGGALALPCEQEFIVEESEVVGQFLGINDEGPAGILPPGKWNSIALEITPDLQTEIITVSVITVVEPDAEVGWAALKEQLRPVFVPSDAWEIIYNNFRLQVGETYGSLHQRFVSEATYLSEIGRRTNEVGELILFELQKADGFGQISQRFVSSDFGRGRPDNRTISLELRDEQLAIVKMSGNQRLFRAESASSFLEIGGRARLEINGNPQILEADGTRLVFDGSGLLVSIEDPNGNLTTYQYDGRKLASIADEAGNRVQYEYNSYGRVSRIVDNLGSVSQYTYDASGEHLLSESDASGTVHFSYVTTGGAANEHAVASIQFNAEPVMSFDYDERGRIHEITRGAGETVVSYAYDDNGAVVTTNAIGAETTLFHTLTGVARVTDPLGRQASSQLSLEAGSVIVNTLGGARWEYMYDDFGNVVSTIDPLGTTIFADFNEQNQIQQLLDENGNPTQYRYDSRGNVTVIRLADGSEKRLTYDAQGNVVEVQNRRGEVTTLTYDGRNLVRVDQPDSTVTEFEYDARDNVLQVLKSESTDQRVITFSRDQLDRISSVTDDLGRSLHYIYDSQGRVVSMDGPGDLGVRYLYDDLGRLNRVLNESDDVLAEYDYDAADRPVGIRRANGMATSLQYDLLDRITAISHTTSGGSSLGSYQYEYNQAGMVSAADTPEGRVEYEYDALNQLRSVQLPTGRRLEYSYDAAGNRTSVQDSDRPAPVTYRTNSLNQYVSSSESTFQYDLDGNLTAETRQGEPWDYQYDSANRLVRVENSSSVWTYEYDALGRRMAMEHDGVRVEYLYDLFGRLVGTYDEQGALVAQYFHGVGLLGAEMADGTDLFYQFDNIGNTTQITDQNASVVNSYSYLPFGHIAQSAETLDNPFTFSAQAGAVHDDNGLYFMRARYYEPGNGRFLSMDPIGPLGEDLNLYRYVGNNPVNFVDPTGTDWTLNTMLTAAGLSTEVGNSVDMIDGQLNGAVNQLESRIASGQRPGRPLRNLQNNLAHLQDDLANRMQYLKNVRDRLDFPDSWLKNQDDIIRRSKEILKKGKDFMQRMKGFDEAIGQATKKAIAREVAERGAREGLKRGFARTAFKFMGSAALKFLTNPYVGAADAGWTIGSLLRLIPGVDEGTQYSVRYWFDPGNNVSDVLVRTVRQYCEENPDKCEEFLARLQNNFTEDPNDIVGPAGFGDEHFITGAGILPYTIRFENLPTATGSVQEVEITHTLAPEDDPASFILGPVQFGSRQVTPPFGVNQWQTLVDLRSENGHDLEIVADLNPDTRTVTWKFTVIDPATGQLTRDPIAGFLPPNDPPGPGAGSVSYLVVAQDPLATGDTIDAQARIVFDVNDPIDTPVWTNTIDAASPGSTVAALSAETYAATFDVSWSGQDDPGGSGVANYDLFVSDNGGLFLLWLADTTATSAQFTGQDRHTYAFYSIARDNVGHVELPAPMSDAETTINLRPWQNRRNNLDGNDDGFVTPIPDIIARINEINSPAFIDADGILPLPPPSPIPFYYDRDGDNRLTPVQDILPVLNFINRQSSGEPEEPPASGSLFLLPGGRPWLVDAAGIRVGQDHVAAEDLPLQAWRPPSAVSPRDELMARLGRRPAMHNANRSNAEYGLLDIDELLADLAPDLANEWFADGQRP